MGEYFGVRRPVGKPREWWEVAVRR